MFGVKFSALSWTSLILLGILAYTEGRGERMRWVHKLNME